MQDTSWNDLLRRRLPALGGRSRVRRTAPHGRERDALPRRRSRVQHAWREFLRVPVVIAAGCLGLATLTSVADVAMPKWLNGVRSGVAVLLHPPATETVLTTVTPGLITTVSIIFFVLLMALNKVASDLTPVVLDQFLRRGLNRFAFGLYVGVMLYAVVVLAVVPTDAAVLSTAVFLVLALVGIALLPILMYLTVDQMRPASVVWVVYRMALRARTAQEPLLARCRVEAHLPDAPGTRVCAGQDGYVVHIDGERMDHALRQVRRPVEIEFKIGMGYHVAPGTLLAHVRAEDPDEREYLAGMVLTSVALGHMQDLDRDAAHAINQLAAMSWSAASTDPQSCRYPLNALRCLLAKWGPTDTPDPDRFGEPLPIVYDDEVRQKLIDALVSVIVAACAARQHQTCSLILTILAEALPRLDTTGQNMVVDRLHRVLPTTTGQMLTQEMDEAFDHIRGALEHAGYLEVAEHVARIKRALATQHQAAAV